MERFGQVFEIESSLIYDFLPKRAWVRGKEIMDCRFRIAMATLKNGSQIEMIEAVSGETPHKEFIDAGGQGIHHIAFYTDRYDQWINYFKGLDISILFEAEAEDDIKGYRRCFYAEDPKLRCIVEFTEISRYKEKQV